MKTEFKEYKKTATVKAKLFEKGDEDGMTTPENFTMLDAMENDKYGCGQPHLVPYIATIESQKHRGEFGKFYLCVGIKGEKWLVEKDIFEATYEKSEHIDISEPKQPEPAQDLKSADQLFNAYSKQIKVGTDATIVVLTRPSAIKAMKEYAKQFTHKP